MELLQKIKISIFEKYIPLHRLQRNNAAKRHGPSQCCHSHTEHHQSSPRATVVYPNMCLQFWPSCCRLVLGAIRMSWNTQFHTAAKLASY